MEKKEEFYYTKYSTRRVVFREEVWVSAESKEEADKIIRDSLDNQGFFDEDDVYSDGEFIDCDSEYPEDFYVCDEDDTVVISKKMLDEYECK